MGHLWDLVQNFQDRQQFEVSDRAIAIEAGIDPSTFNRWKKRVRRPPQPEHLRGLAAVIEQPYRVVLDAALADGGWLTESEMTPATSSRPYLTDAARRKKPPKKTTKRKINNPDVSSDG